MNGSMELSVQIASDNTSVPSAASLQRWMAAALARQKSNAELCVRIVDEAEMAALNEQYRGKQGTTNVLAFPYQAVAGLSCDLLGDIVVCAPVVEREALQQDKSSVAHWAHMVVHGVLHLLGYDHQQPQDARRMERLETEVLAALDFPPPYATRTAGDPIQQ